MSEKSALMEKYMEQFQTGELLSHQNIVFLHCMLYPIQLFQISPPTYHAIVFGILTGSTASTRVLQMQAELEPLKSANRDLQAQVDQLRTAAAVAANNAGSSNRELEQEQK